MKDEVTKPNPGEQLVYGNHCPVCDTPLAIPRASEPKPSSPSAAAQIEWPSHKEVNEANRDVGTAVAIWAEGWNAALYACKLAYAAALDSTQPQMGPGDYSCAKCGMGMVEPCEHWKKMQQEAPTQPEELARRIAEARAQAFKEAGDIASTTRIFTNDDCHAVMSRIASALYGMSATPGQKEPRAGRDLERPK